MSGADAPPGVPRILAMVSQSGGLGDVLIASLFLRALRRWRPDARIDLFCGPQGAPAARLLGLRSPLVGRPWPGPLDLLADAWRLRREGRFDEVYSLSEVRSTIWLARAARARRTAGYDWEGRGRGLDLRLPWRPEANLALRHLELLREVGAPAEALDPAVPSLAVDGEACRATLDRFGLVPFRYGVLHPGASKEMNRWDAGRFASLLPLLGGTGLRWVVCGSNGERSLAARVCAGSDALDLAGRTPLDGLAHLLSRADVVVGNDSGPLHLADFLGRPTVGLYLPFNAGRYGPLRRGSHAVVPRSGRLDDVSAEEVASRVVAVLGPTLP